MADDTANCVCASQISSTLFVKLFTVVRAFRTWYAYIEMSKADPIGKVDGTNLANGQTLKNLAGVTKSGHNHSRSYKTCKLRWRTYLCIVCDMHLPSSPAKTALERSPENLGPETCFTGIILSSAEVKFTRIPAAKPSTSAILMSIADATWVSSFGGGPFLRGESATWEQVLFDNIWPFRGWNTRWGAGVVQKIEGHGAVENDTRCSMLLNLAQRCSILLNFAQFCSNFFFKITAAG